MNPLTQARGALMTIVKADNERDFLTADEAGKLASAIAAIDAALSAAPAALAKPAQQAGWKCSAVTADFSDNTITLQMSGTGWEVSAGEYLLTPPADA